MPLLSLLSLVSSSSPLHQFVSKESRRRDGIPYVSIDELEIARKRRKPRSLSLNGPVYLNRADSIHAPSAADTLAFLIHLGGGGGEKVRFGTDRLVAQRRLYVGAHTLGVAIR